MMSQFHLPSSLDGLAILPFLYTTGGCEELKNISSYVHRCLEQKVWNGRGKVEEEERG